MGYYSEVSILCGRNVAKKLVELPTLFGCSINKRSDGCYRFYWESVKWYETMDEEVDAVMKVVKDFLHKDYGEEGPRREDFCSYIRIGEDSGDTEHEANSCVYDEQWVQCRVGIVGNEFCTDYKQPYARKMIECGDW